MSTESVSVSIYLFELRYRRLDCDGSCSWSGQDRTGRGWAFSACDEGQLKLMRILTDCYCKEMNSLAEVQLQWHTWHDMTWVTWHDMTWHEWLAIWLLTQTPPPVWCVWTAADERETQRERLREREEAQVTHTQMDIASKANQALSTSTRTRSALVLCCKRTPQWTSVDTSDSDLFWVIEPRKREQERKRGKNWWCLMLLPHSESLVTGVHSESLTESNLSLLPPPWCGICGWFSMKQTQIQHIKLFNYLILIKSINQSLNQIYNDEEIIDWLIFNFNKIKEFIKWSPVV